MTKPQKGGQAGAPKQHFRPMRSLLESFRLLERENLTEQEVLDFCCSQQQRQHTPNENDLELDAFYARRKELLELRKKLVTGHARIDLDGRLVAVSNPRAPPAVILPPPPPPPPPDINNNNLNPLVQPPNAIHANANLNNNNNNVNMVNFNLDQEEAEAQWLVQQEREAAAAIARAVERYRRQGVPNGDLTLVRVRPPVPARRVGAGAGGGGGRFTLRRICIAVSGVAMAFLFLMLHTLPIGAQIFFQSFAGSTGSGGSGLPAQREWDVKLLYELLQIKEYEEHAEECGWETLDRNQTRIFSWERWWNNSLWYFGFSGNVDEQADCSDGVLLIPSQLNLLRMLLRKRSAPSTFLQAPMRPEKVPRQPNEIQDEDSTTATPPHRNKQQEHDDLQRDDELLRRRTGIDTVWFMDCHPPSSIASSAWGTPIGHHHYPGFQRNTAIQQCTASDGDEEGENEESVGDNCTLLDESAFFQPKPQKGPVCFRGVHDDVVGASDVTSVLSFGKDLIMLGGDHFDVYEAGHRLESRLPKVVEKVRNILQTRYGLGVHGYDISPVAFRIHAVAPMNGASVTHGHGDHQQNHKLVGLLNLTKYVEYVDLVSHRNEMAAFSLPWPLRVEPFRDPCHLMADLQADPRFGIHTTLFLSDGSGEDYRGGVSLYVDNHKSNSSPQKMIQRGVAIDGSAGRLVVSTGGFENQRCRLPVMAGIRVTLQMWWN